MNYLQLGEHQLEDQTCHAGASDYYCRFCGESEHDIRRGYQKCEKAAAVLAREKQDQENRERNEYRELLRQRQRFEELNAKYGSGR
jgi:hypothetical protein